MSFITPKVTTALPPLKRLICIGEVCCKTIQKQLAIATMITLVPRAKWGQAGKSYRGGRISTVDLLVLSSLDQLIFYIENIIFIVTKQVVLMRRSTVLSLPFS